MSLFAGRDDSAAARFYPAGPRGSGGPARIGCPTSNQPGLSELRTDGLLEKGQFLHRVVLPVSRPERGAAQHSACGNQGIVEFHCVALSVASEVVACLAACFRIDRNACQSTEQVVEGVLFRRARPGPKLGGADRRIQDGNVGAAQLGPSGDQIRVSPARHLSEDIGIDQDAHFAVSLSSRSPRRRLRTISTASGVSEARLRIPTNACIAFIRWPWFPR